MNLDKVLNGINFKQAADVSILREWPRSLQEQPFNSLEAKREYFDGAIIFCDSYYLPCLFNEIRNHDNKYILISHLRDEPVTRELFELKPKCIKKWFALNADYKHPDLVPIPIGIENHTGAWKGTLIDLPFWEDYNISNKYIKEKSLLVNFQGKGSQYFSHGSRQAWIEQLTNQGFHVSERMPSIENLNNTRQHYLCASPRGNGIDCHRTWEALYFDCIPIVPKHHIYDNFNAPILQVESEKCIDKKLIGSLVSRYNNGEFSFDKRILNIDYWLDAILAEKKNL